MGDASSDAEPRRLKSPVRWGILGCGDVTEKKSGPAFQKARHSELVAVMRRSPGLAQEYARRHGVGRWYEDADALIADPDVDAVYVATPPGSHTELALRCARARKPCYVEKPMARSTAECQSMIEAFRAAGVPLFVAYYRRALPRFLAIKKAIESGEIGAVRFVSIVLRRAVSPGERDPQALPWRVRPEIAGGGHFVDLACHTLDFLDFALGPIDQVAGFAENQAAVYPAEDAVAMSLRFQSGALGTGAFSFAAGGSADEVVVTGSDGELRFATFADEPIRIQKKDGSREESIAHPLHIQQPLIQAIVDELLGGGPPSPSTGETALRTTWVMEQALSRAPWATSKGLGGTS
jgi:1,5-anhydro-D-fructose reductase (1,5-anhydro-D-mannitol-forming)